jgi:hypothetical protein
MDKFFLTENARILRMSARRIKGWISRMAGMKKDGTYTQAVAAVRVIVADDPSASHFDQRQDDAVDALGMETNSDDDSLDIGTYMERCLEDQMPTQGMSPAPQPPKGFRHIPGIVVLSNALLGHRLQYRFQHPHGWMSAILVKIIGGREVRAMFEDNETVTIELWDSEHGATCRWVLWEAIDTDRPLETNAIVEIPSGYQLVPAPSAEEFAEHGRAWFRGLPSTACIFFNMEAPFDWCRGSLQV